MKKHFATLSIIMLSTFSATCQIPITAVDTATRLADSSFTYTIGGHVYNWGIAPNDSVTTLSGFNAGSNGYSYMDTVPGRVKLRRVDNALTTGNLTLEWVQTKTTGSTFNLFPSYQNNMDTFLTGNTYNKGTDNLFDNTAANSNDIERLDWILTKAYATPTPDQVGIAVFDKGDSNTHDPFCIAAITSVDSAGNPLTYGKIVRVVKTNYGDPGPFIPYRILKAQYPDTLVSAGFNTQNIGGVFITLQDLGVAINDSIFGYSLFANDLPVSATPADLVDFTNAAFFPLNTPAAAGGLDLVAVTGLNIATSIVLPVNFLNFNAVDNNDNVKLLWSVENEIPGQKYDVERSGDGVHFSTINEIIKAGSASANSYSFVDNISSLGTDLVYYRIKQYEADGSYHYSKTILVRRNHKTFSILIYPNPVQNNLYLNIASTGNDKIDISIFNSAGARMMQLHESLANGNNSFTIDNIGKLARGTYQLHVKWMKSGNSITKQFSKQ